MGHYGKLSGVKILMVTVAVGRLRVQRRGEAAGSSSSSSIISADGRLCHTSTITTLQAAHLSTGLQPQQEA